MTRNQTGGTLKGMSPSLPAPAAMQAGGRTLCLAILLIAITVLAVTALIAGESEAAATGVAWRPLTLDEALARAMREHRVVMVDVWSEQCGQCLRMDTEMWATDRAAALAANLIPIKVNSATPEGAILMSRYPVTGLPATLFIRGDGTEIDRITGYDGADAFFRDAGPMARGVDPLEAMERTLAARPDSLPLALDVLTRYLDRGRDTDAGRLLDRILRQDGDNGTGTAERALSRMARYQEYFRQDRAASYDYWKQIGDRFPRASSIGGALDGSARLAPALGRRDAWKAWACDLAGRHPALPTLQYAVAMSAWRNGFTGSCFAKAARAARSSGVGSAKLDTIAVQLDR